MGTVDPVWFASFTSLPRPAEMVVKFNVLIGHLGEYIDGIFEEERVFELENTVDW